VAHSLDDVLRDLHASEINGEISWFYDSCWHARLGDSMNGWIAKWESSDLADVADWLVTRSLHEYPDSDFADKYRPPPAEKAATVPVPNNRLRKRTA
jgi:hypothetical protein